MSNYYAMIKENEIIVINTIVADPNFSIDGYYLIEIIAGVFCKIGMFYNKDDGLFYDDDDFKSINGEPI